MKAESLCSVMINYSLFSNLEKNNSHKKEYFFKEARNQLKHQKHSTCMYTPHPHPPLKKIFKNFWIYQSLIYFTVNLILRIYYLFNRKEPVSMLSVFKYSQTILQSERNLSPWMYPPKQRKTSGIKSVNFFPISKFHMSET